MKKIHGAISNKNLQKRVQKFRFGKSLIGKLKIKEFYANWVMKILRTHKNNGGKKLSLIVFAQYICNPIQLGKFWIFAELL